MVDANRNVVALTEPRTSMSESKELCCSHSDTWSTKDTNHQMCRLFLNVPFPCGRKEEENKESWIPWWPNFLKSIYRLEKHQDHLTCYISTVASVARRVEEISPSPSLWKLEEEWKNSVCKEESASFAQEGKFLLKMQPIVHSLTYQALRTPSTWNTT